MSVLKLRRDMVVADESPEAVEIHAPLPLRTIDITPRKVELVEPANANDRRRKRVRPRKSFWAKLKGWSIFAAVTAALAAYPVMILMESDVGDKVGAPVDRTQWTVAWAGGVSTTMDRQYTQFGWAKDAAAWSPMARLTAKPAYQQALAGAFGDFVTLKSIEAAGSNPAAVDSDLSAAGRLLSVNSTGVQVRAAHDALTNYDRRARRRAAAVDASPAHLADELNLMLKWAAISQGEIATAAEHRGNPIDHDATAAVYAAKGRAMAAYLVLDTMAWPAAKDAETARATALAAWKQAAEFHPILVLNGNPDGSIFGNHPTSMGFAIARAETATQDYLKLVMAAGAAAPPPPVSLSNEAVVAGVDLRGPPPAVR